MAALDSLYMMTSGVAEAVANATSRLNYAIQRAAGMIQETPEIPDIPVAGAFSFYLLACSGLSYVANKLMRNGMPLLSAPFYLLDFIFTTPTVLMVLAEPTPSTIAAVVGSLAGNYFGFKYGLKR